MRRDAACVVLGLAFLLLGVACGNDENDRDGGSTTAGAAGAGGKKDVGGTSASSGGSGGRIGSGGSTTSCEGDSCSIDSDCSWPIQCVCNTCGKSFGPARKCLNGCCLQLEACCDYACAQ